MKQKLSALITVLFLLSGCGAEPPEGAMTLPPTLPPEATQAPTLPPETEPQPTLSPGEKILAAMTLREKVGQLFLVRPDSLDLSLSPEAIDDPNSSGVTSLNPELRDALEEYPVGGFVLFSKNIQSPDQVLNFNISLRDATRIPPFISVDEEGGAVARLANAPGFDLIRYRSAGAVGSEAGPEGAYGMGKHIGTYLKDYGFNMDFAPVADVNTNPQNPVIGTRAFSSDPELAAQCAGAMAQGLTEAGIIPVYKHFPGHGDTAQDSHKGLAVSYKTIDDLLACEWIPFRQATDRNCIMVGHIALPEVTGDMTPATLSYSIVSGLLRQHLGFQGLIITDSLSMGAITQDRDPAQAAVDALSAGCDLLLMPQSLPQAFEGVLSALESGSLTQDQLDDTVLRILNFKLDHGILKP